MAMSEDQTDVAVVGGGVVGAAIALGLARRGLKTTILDEGDRAKRASRANFALVWVQSKGLGMPAYLDWTRRSAGSWQAFAIGLREEAGLDLCLEQRGGFSVALSDTELERQAKRMAQRHNEQGGDFEYRVLDHAETAAMLPHIGPDVTGSIFCPYDGHVNGWRLLRALHTAFAARGGHYVPEATVGAIAPRTGSFRLETAQGALEAGRIVLAAGLGNAPLAPMVGLEAPVRALRGQILVTERLKRFLDYPTTTVRQTDEGTVMIGDSQEDATSDLEVDASINAVMAARAVRIFPLLAKARIVRTWAGLRIMSPDGCPIYDQSSQWPGAFLATCHSGVTLAAGHAGAIADAIADGHLPSRLAAFSARRFATSAA